MTIRSAGRATAAPREGRTSGRTGRGGGRTSGRSGDQGNGEIHGQGGQVGGRGNEVNDGVDGVPDFSTIIAQQLQNLLPTIVAQVGDQGRNQGNGRNQNGDAINDNIKGDYDGKGCAIVYTRWIEKMESVQDMSGCEVNQKVKYTAGSFVGKVSSSLSNPEKIAGTLTDEALRNGSIKKNPEKRRNGGEPNKDRNVRDDNKRTRTGNAFATTTNPVGRENSGHFSKDCRVVPSNVNPVNARNLAVARGACYECESTDHYKSACPRLNRAQGPGGNRPNQALLTMGVRVVETKGTMKDGGHSCWEQRRLAKTRTS
ncbi:hypothetical protein Tco_0360336 [Tanacetum coccineum]